MEREIKFRAKGEHSEEWCFGNLVDYGDGEVEIQGFDVFRDGNDDWREIKVIPQTIGQFTGLKDKNGKEIYEGDIVITPLLDPIFGDIIKDAFCNAEIRFNKGSFVVSYYKRDHNIYISDLHDKIEVIGNIFDNKELLEDEQ